MIQKKAFLCGVLLALSLAGCDPKQEPETAANQPESAAGDAAQGPVKGPEPAVTSVEPGPADAPTEGPLKVDCGPHTQPPNAQARITLNADGQILKTETVAHDCNWEDALEKISGPQPNSVGEPVGTINVFAMGEDDSILVDNGGGSAHGHAGGSHGTFKSHCHKWYQSGNDWYLVHC